MIRSRKPTHTSIQYVNGHSSLQTIPFVNKCFRWSSERTASMESSIFWTRFYLEWWTIISRTLPWGSITYLTTSGRTTRKMCSVYDWTKSSRPHKTVCHLRELTAFLAIFELFEVLNSPQKIAVWEKRLQWVMWFFPQQGLFWSSSQKDVAVFFNRLIMLDKMFLVL